MNNKRIDKIKFMLGKNKGFEANGLPESSLLYILIFFVAVVGLFLWLH